MPKLFKKTRELQTDFIKWLKDKNSITTCNFSKMRASKYQISNDRKFVKEVKNDVTKVYSTRIERCNREKCVDVEEEEEIVAWRNVISYMHEDRRMPVESVFPLEDEPSNAEYYAELPERIQESVMQQKVCATSNTSMKGERISGLMHNEKK